MEKQNSDTTKINIKQVTRSTSTEEIKAIGWCEELTEKVLRANLPHS